MTGIDEYSIGVFVRYTITGAAVKKTAFIAESLGFLIGVFMQQIKILE
jgi:hypothetical protein